MTTSQPRSLLIGLTLVLAACGGEGLTLPPDGAAAHIEVLWGNNQSARVGEALPDTVVVRVTDTQNRPVSGVDVVFDFTTGGSSAGPAAATNSEGITWSRLVLGTVPGPLTGKARVPVDAGITPVEAAITATATPADANGIAEVSGNDQAGLVGTQLPAPLVVAVTDQFGNPISGVPVQWTVTGGGSVSEAATVTGADGQTSVTRTLGSGAGQQTTLATAAFLAGSPVPFRHTATAGTASTIVKIAGDVGSAPAGSVLDLVVEVRDANGNPIPNAPVTWLVGEGGGSATPSGNTNSEGRATSRWTLGSSPGTNTLNVVSSGGATTSFTVTGTGTGAPSKLAVSTQPPSSVTIGATLSPGPIVQVKDAADHDVPTAGVDISVSLASGPGSLEGTRTVTTDATGRAQFSDLRISGATGKHRLIFAADGLQSIRSITFDVVAVPNNAPTAEFSVSCTSLVCQFTDESADGDGTVVGWNWDFGDPGSGGQNGSTSRNPTHTFTGSGTYTVTLTARDNDDATNPHSEQVTVVAAPPVNQAPVANDDPSASAAPYTTPGAGAPLTVSAGDGVLQNDTDPDNDALTAVNASTPAQGSVVLSLNGSFTYTPNPGASGTDTFTYQASDGQLSSTAATVTINITP